MAGRARVMRAARHTVQQWPLLLASAAAASLVSVLLAIAICARVAHGHGNLALHGPDMKIEENEERGTTIWTHHWGYDATIRPHESAMPPPDWWLGSWRPEATWRGAIVEVGWPWRCFYCRIIGEPFSTLTPVQGTVDLPWFGTPDVPSVPVRPRWSGLLANVGAGTLMVVVLRGIIARARARVRGPGRCRQCGYSLAGLAPGAPCPECGKQGVSPERV